MRSAKVYMHEKLAGRIRETDEGYEFVYDAAFVSSDFTSAVSLTLPKRDEPYVSKFLFPFFDGLIPEGWLLVVAAAQWRVPEKDRFGLLITVCEETIGAVPVRAE